MSLLKAHRSGLGFTSASPRPLRVGRALMSSWDLPGVPSAPSQLSGTTLEYDRQAQGPSLFLRMEHRFRGRPLSPVSVWLYPRGGVNSEGYTGHSFRIGAAMAAARAGVPTHLIKAMERWSSDAFMVYPRRHWLASPQCSLVLPSNPVLNDSLVCIPLISLLSIVFVSLLLLFNSTILFTHVNDNFSPVLGLGAQVPSRWSGLTFSPEYHSRSPSSITRPKPGGVVRSAVPGAPGPRLPPSGQSRSPLDGLPTRYALRNSWPGRGGDPCGIIPGY